MLPDEQKREIEAAGHRAIYSYNQTDFVKERVAVEVQFGKYAFVAYDLFVKHMAFYVGDVIDVGVEILPMKTLQKWMSLSPRKGIGGEQDRTPLERYGLSNVLLIRATKGQGGQTTAIGAGFERFSA